MPRFCIRALNDLSGITPLLHHSTLDRRDIFTSMSQHAGHPNQLIQKSIDASDEVLIEQSSALIEKCPDFSEVHVFENRHQAKLAHHWQKVFNHPRATEWPGRHATYSHRLLEVILQIHLERMLQQSGTTMSVFGRDDDQPVAPFDGR